MLKWGVERGKFFVYDIEENPKMKQTKINTERMLLFFKLGGLKRQGE